MARFIGGLGLTTLGIFIVIIGLLLQLTPNKTQPSPGDHTSTHTIS